MPPESTAHTRTQAPSAWLVTSADLTALMLAFFVMIFAMSSLDAEKWQVVVSRLSDPVSQDRKTNLPPVSPDSIETVDAPPALPLGYLGRLLREKLDSDAMLRQAIVVPRANRIFVSLSSDALFASGDTRLKPAAREALDRLSGVFATIGNRIDIYGHTHPAQGGKGAGEHWRLSLLRAVAVADELKRIGYERNITMLGLGDSRYVHLDPGLPAAQRDRLAHRVDIVIHPTKEEAQ
jgi:chemotaxis protein MotB